MPPHSSRASLGLPLTRSLASDASRSDNPFVDPGAPGAPVVTEPEKNSEPSPESPPRQPFYKGRGFIITVVMNCIGIIFLFVMLFPVVRAITQDVVNAATIDITTAIISNPTNSSFDLLIQGTVSHVSDIPAIISFPKPVNVSWVDGSTEVPLGYMQLFTIHTSSNHATLNQTTTFYITNETAFGHFTSSATTSQNFTWKLESSDLTVQAKKFPVAHGISFNKMITMNGFNNFYGNVQLEQLQLPSGNITNGISFVATAQLTNQSPFSLDLGTIAINLTYQDVYLGNCANLATNLSVGNITVSCSGALVPQPTLFDVIVVSQLVTNYFNQQTSTIVATGKSAVQSDGTIISWISQAVDSLTLTVPLLPSTPIIPLGGFLNISSHALPYTAE